MTEPATSAAAGIAAWKFGLLAKIGTLLGVGGIGGLLVAAADTAHVVPDRAQRLKLTFVQFVAAGVVSISCTPATMRWLDAMFDWINLAACSNWDECFQSWAELALPVGLLYGALSWGIIGMLVKLRIIVRDRGADAIAARAGLDDKAGPT